MKKFVSVTAYVNSSVMIFVCCTVNSCTDSDKNRHPDLMTGSDSTDDNPESPEHSKFRKRGHK